VRLLVLAGTEDGRELAQALKERGHDILVSTLTAYGADLALGQGLQARSGAMDAQTLTDLLKGGSFAALVDATHPYALKVKEMAKIVCETLALPYLRWERSALELEEHPLLHWAEDIPSAAQIAAKLGQQILLTTGSNALPEWVSLPSLKNKELYIRVLPTSQVLARCESLGFKPKQIIAAQGPFSQEWDEAMFKQLGIEVVVAKESGRIGGTLEKVQACLSLHIPLVLLKRPPAETNDSQALQASTIPQFIKHLEEVL
jgi:precorrin-6x reductase